MIANNQKYCITDTNILKSKCIDYTLNILNTHNIL